jgi:hypothetical protein
MAVWKVEVVCHNIFELEAKNEDEAHDKAVQLMRENEAWTEALESTIELSDCQYTDQQELQDRERDHDRR